MEFWWTMTLQPPMCHILSVSQGFSQSSALGGCNNRKLCKTQELSKNKNALFTPPAHTHGHIPAPLLLQAPTDSALATSSPAALWVSHCSGSDSALWVPKAKEEPEMAFQEKDFLFVSHICDGYVSPLGSSFERCPGSPGQTTIPLLCNQKLPFWETAFSFPGQSEDKWDTQPEAACDPAHCRGVETR